MTPTLSTDQQKIHLSEKCSVHLKPLKQNSNIYCTCRKTNPSGSLTTVQMTWNQDTLSPKIPHRDSHWIISDESNRWLRWNKHDIKLLYIRIAQKRPQPKNPVKYPVDFSEDDPTTIASIGPSANPEVQSKPFEITEANHHLPVAPRKPRWGKSQWLGNQSQTSIFNTQSDWFHHGREVKPARNPDFLYNWV